jgi:hypothetical protein
MKTILSYLLSLLAAIVLIVLVGNVPESLGWGGERGLLVQCGLIGMAAGILYCLRAVYVNKGLDRWNADWEIWYFLRPITSGVSGFVSCIFLRAGLLALSSTPKPDATPYGYLAVAFIAGYNVDFFMKKIEAIAQELWGIDRSRASQSKGEQDKSNRDDEK